MIGKPLVSRFRYITRNGEKPKSSPTLAYKNELEEINRRFEEDLSPRERWEEYEFDSDNIANEPNSIEMASFRREAETGLGQLAVTNFESPGESDPSYGKFKITRRDIDRLETAIPSQMNPPQPE